MQVKKVDVTFLGSSKHYSFSPQEFSLKVGDKVIVDTVRGLELGEVCSEISLTKEGSEPLKKVVRLATEKDIKIKQENNLKEKEIKQKTEELSVKFNLDMKVTNAELNFDRTKIVINFTSDNRVDFRELVKELATIFKCRIELKQIGSRDETKVIGGLGPCGRPCCCNTFLNDFEHSTIKMAKIQGLSLNPTKISGLCGRLMCCLSYENSHYSETFKLMPKINSVVGTPIGKGVAVYNNLLKKIVQVKFTTKDGTVEIKDFKLEEIKILNNTKENSED